MPSLALLRIHMEPSAEVAQLHHKFVARRILTGRDLIEERPVLLPAFFFQLLFGNLVLMT